MVLKFREGLFHSRDPVMSPRGGLTMLPRPSPRGAVSMTEESVVPLCLSLERAAGPTRLRTHNDTDTGHAEK